MQTWYPIELGSYLVIIIMNLEEILAIENDSSFLDFKCSVTGYLLWPLIRQEFIQFLISDFVYKNSPLISLNRDIDYRNALPSLIKAEYHNLLLRRKAKNNVLLMASGAGLFLRDGKWFNRLSDYFALANPQNTLVLEDFFNWQWPSPRHNKNIIYSAPMQTYVALKGRVLVNGTHVNKAKEIVSQFSNRAKEMLQWNLDESATLRFETRMARKIAEVPIRKEMYENFLNSMSIKLVIKEEGCYGHSSVFNKTAKELGIVVAEYQHGTINAGHDAYNVAFGLLSSQDYVDTLPQYFLSYGDWWHQYLKLPVNKVLIGNPHRTTQLARLSSDNKKSNILILGDGVETEMYLNLAVFLSKNQTALKVIFRPHPLERTKLKSLLVSKNLGNVVIDENLDIYNSFCNAHVVVNEVSTGLFEAVGLADRVLIWDTPKSKFYYPNHPFASFVDENDLLEKIIDGKTGLLDAQCVQTFWADGWEENYENFLNNYN